MKDIIVQKFGGTSVADTDKIKNVAKAVIREKKKGNDIVVVVSAMGHTTDILTKLAKEISKQSVKTGCNTDILLEVNIGDEESKWGFKPNELTANIVEICRLGRTCRCF